MMKLNREKVVAILKIVGTAIVSILVTLGLVSCAGTVFKASGNYEIVRGEKC